MSSMEITTKVGCKIGCLYCPQEKIIKAYTKRSDTFMMSFDTFKTSLNKIPVGVDLHFSGMSEPWLNPECTKMLLYAHKRGHKIAVFSTLVGMNLTDIDSLQNVPCKSFFVHLPSNEGYERIKVDDNYLKLLEKLVKSTIKLTFCFHGQTPHFKVMPLIIEL